MSMKVALSEIKLNCLCVYKFLNRAKEGLVAGKRANFYRLLYLEKGSMNFFVDDKKYSLNPGDVFFMPAGTQYATDSLENEMVLYNVLFSVGNADDFFKDNLKYNIFSDLTERCRVEFTDFPELNDCRLYRNLLIENDFRKLEREYFKREKLSLLKINASLTEVLIKLIESSLNRNEESLYKKIAAYAEENAAQDIDCESIAAHFNYHPNYLNRVVKINSGVSLHTFLTNVKCKEAAKLLLSTNRTITEIAQELYFCDSSHFTNVFGKVMGMTPSAYRKNYR